MPSYLKQPFQWKKGAVRLLRLVKRKGTVIGRGPATEIQKPRISLGSFDLSWRTIVKKDLHSASFFGEIDESSSSQLHLKGSQ